MINASDVRKDLQHMVNSKISNNQRAKRLAARTMKDKDKMTEIAGLYNAYVDEEKRQGNGAHGLRLFVNDWVLKRSRKRPGSIRERRGRKGMK